MLIQISLNFEHLSSTEKLLLQKNKTINLNKKKKLTYINTLDSLKNQNSKLFYLYMKNQIEKNKNDRLKKEKLKLGTVVFEIKELTVAGYVVGDSIEMVYSRLDNTEMNSLKIENKLKELKWKWNFDNIFSLFLIISSFIFYFYSYFLTDIYQNLLQSLHDTNLNNDFLLKNVKNILFSNLTFFNKFNNCNSILNSDLLDIFNLLFW